MGRLGTPPGRYLARSLGISHAPLPPPRPVRRHCRRHSGPPDAAAPRRPTVRIGVLTDLSGQYRDNSGPTTVLAAKQAVEDFNPSAHGFRGEVIAADHQQKPDVGAGIARQWFDRDGVDMIADVNNTAIALAVGRVASEKNKALLMTGAASVDLTGKYCNPNTRALRAGYLVRPAHDRQRGAEGRRQGLVSDRRGLHFRPFPGGPGDQAGHGRTAGAFLVLRRIRFRARRITLPICWRRRPAGRK